MMMTGYSLERALKMPKAPKTKAATEKQPRRQRSNQVCVDKLCSIGCQKSNARSQRFFVVVLRSSQRPEFNADLHIQKLRIGVTKTLTTQLHQHFRLKSDETTSEAVSRICGIEVAASQRRTWREVEIEREKEGRA